jgi:hypothetical protein
VRKLLKRRVVVSGECMLHGKTSCDPDHLVGCRCIV